jgi:SpoVK/Ycf46/Vps4 family AAA+-type ATPase
VLRFNVPREATSPVDGVPLEVERAASRALQQFHVDAAALDQALAGVTTMDQEEEVDDRVWGGLREAARGGLDALAQRLDSRATFEDLVVPASVSAQLHEIVSQLRHRQQVYDEWGFGDRDRRGLGIAALFAGESGTGKTLAAEAIANAVRLDLYRIDLASIVSKYIGETEKNLSRLFDAAERSGAVLLFDEADALFGKRSEVRDSHDRYANIEVAYLLQRIETYRGLAVLTTNMKSALDRSFLRRIRFIVQFPFPDQSAREQIWRRQFPARAPLNGIDYGALAKLQLSGGHIRSVALNAAFRAAGHDRAIEHSDVVASARAEFAKLERTFTPPPGTSA